MDKEKIWQAVLENLKINLSQANFSAWFPQTFITQIKTVDPKRQIVEIGCPHLFARTNIENRYYSLIKEALDQATEKTNDLVFIVKQIKKINPKPLNEPLFQDQKKVKGKALKKVFEKAGLKEDFNFDSFAVSFTNQMAHAAALAVSKTPGKAYNPLFLYGGVGVGKTHLMQAIAHEVLKRRQNTKIVYCTSEDFTNEIVEAIRHKSTNEFKKKYRPAKLLLVDDIQFIAGKDRAQEEFFHTFNSIKAHGGQIILTSDSPPDKIKKLEDRLRSRFEGGLTIDIQPPDFELRSAILLIKAQQRRIKLPMDVAQLIAANVTSTRKLEGTLIRLNTESQTRNQPLTPELAAAIIGQNNQQIESKHLVRPKEILSAVASFYELKISDLTGPRRLKPLASARQVLMYLLRTELKVPHKEIGRLLGDRDHSTIIYGVEKITNNLSTSEALRVDIVGIKQKLYG